MTNITLWRTGASHGQWLVDASLRANGDLAICSGDANREWYAIVAAGDVERLRSALVGPAVDPAQDVLELLHQRFARDADSANPFDEILSFLDAHRVGVVRDCW